MKTPEERDLDAMEWLPVARWDSDTTFNEHKVAGKRLCKICDKWIELLLVDDHVESHIKTRAKLIQKRREEAAEASRLARELQKQEREASKPPAPPKRPRGRPRKVRTPEELEAEAAKELRKVERLLAKSRAS